MCACDQNSVPSCCKPSIEKNISISAPDCCGDAVCFDAGSATPTIRIGSLNLSHTPETIHLSKAFIPQFRVYLLEDRPAPKLFIAGRYKLWPRPPDLYVRHHAFLI